MKLASRRLGRNDRSSKFARDCLGTNDDKQEKHVNSRAPVFGLNFVQDGWDGWFAESDPGPDHRFIIESIHTICDGPNAVGCMVSGLSGLTDSDTAWIQGRTGETGLKKTGGRNDRHSKFARDCLGTNDGR